MLTSLHPTSLTPSDQAVKDLLDQRARASHTRYTSVSFSQCSDSPSIYSRGDISPNPLCAPLAELPVRSGHNVSLADQSIFDDVEDDLQSPSSTEYASYGHRYAQVNDDDDGKSFVSAPTPRAASHREDYPTHSPGSDVESQSISKIEEDPRMSLLGPKMRFVSRAPWEADEDDLLDEEEESGVVDNMSIFGGKLGSKRAKDPDKHSIKGLGLATIRSRSPGPPSGPLKKSGVAVNLGLYRHRSPEPRSDGPYGPYLSGASHSHSAVLNTHSSTKFSHSVTDSQSSHDLSYNTRDASGPTSPSSQTGTLPSHQSPKSRAFHTQKLSLSSRDDSSVSSFRSESPPPLRFIHPYANPELIPRDPSPLRPITQVPRKGRDKSNEELESWTSPLCQSDSPLSSPRMMNLRNISTGVILSPAPRSWQTDGRNNGHGSLHSSADRTGSKHSNLEQEEGSMRGLISLEQARARGNSSHVSDSMQNIDMSRSPATSTLVAGLGLAPGVVESGVIRGAVTAPLPRMDMLIAEPRNQEPPRRPRTMSSGKRLGGASAALGPDSDLVPTKTLKQKKSAFMKLFQSGKEKEREKEQLKEPTFPVLSPRRAVSTPSASAADHPLPPLPGTHNIKRVPPPLPLSVVVTSPSTGVAGSLSQAAQGTASPPSSPPRRLQASSLLPSSGHPEDHHSPQHDERQTSDESSQYPPSTSPTPLSHTKFTALSLRPVSTMFSSNFPDLLSPSPNPQAMSHRSPSELSSSIPDLHYSRSNSMSTASDDPITPSSVISYPDAPGVAMKSSEYQTAFIAALQEQIVNSRKAWQRQIWELEGQIKDLKDEVEELRNTGECETCGKTKREGRIETPTPQTYRVVDRPRPRLGGNTRSVFGGANDL